MEELIRFQDVEICYGSKKIVENINVSVKPGEILGIVGESGSGKSTLLKAAMGLLDQGGVVTRGDIFFREKNMPDLKPSELREVCGSEIGMIFQDCGASLCPIRTIGDQIFESLSEHRKVSRQEAKEQAFDLFEKIHFRDKQRIWNSYPFELSGGMNQRAGIAIAMLMKPKLLLADEPTSALDVAVQRQVLDEMVSMGELFGTAIILVTHDIGVVSAVADSVLVLKDGRMCEYGSKDQVLLHPEDPYTKELLSAVPRLRREKDRK